ncbi:uncharacterized protein LOC117643351 [Thrips palmi]|uniref:Uncharacterized protein LOC117643351 n=1 Tax=Thrips palmi TaxID=161013 RepID=A0A6P8YVD8_THRPL|nr:uncharacterized protein LOC117643351 [Thrips palmi]
MLRRGSELVVVLIVTLSNRSFQKAISNTAGPFRIIPRYVTHCPPALQPAKPLDFYVMQTRDRHDPDLWYYSGNFTTLFTWTNDQDVDINFASWSSRGGWKENAYIFRVKHYCSAFKTYAPQAWRKIMVAVNGDADADCPWPPGVYHVRNMSTDFRIRAMPAFYYGKWRLTLRLMENHYQDTLGCFVAYADTVPRGGL